MFSNFYLNKGKKSKILLNQNNIKYNVQYLKRVAGGQLCVMIKANAYGHGLKQVVTMLDKDVDFFGVSNQTEGELAKKFTDKNVIVFGICDDYEQIIKENISFILLSYEHAKAMVYLYKKLKIKPKMHLCINSGMNRYGVKNLDEAKKIINYLQKNQLSLEGMYTHFSSLSSDEKYTLRQKTIFEKFISLLPKNWSTIKHVGGGGTIFTDIKADMYRVGLEVYGYGKNVKPILSIESEIIDKQNVKKGEHVGYLCGYTAPKDMVIATIPLGYGDGFPRKLSNCISIKINGQKAKNVGNICMDAFMVDVTDIDCNIGDRVTIFEDAKTFAEICGTTEYEVLTNLSKFRGERKIIKNLKN